MLVSWLHPQWNRIFSGNQLQGSCCRTSDSMYKIRCGLEIRDWFWDSTFCLTRFRILTCFKSLSPWSLSTCTSLSNVSSFWINFCWNHMPEICHIARANKLQTLCSSSYSLSCRNRSAGPEALLRFTALHLIPVNTGLLKVRLLHCSLSTNNIKTSPSFHNAF